MNLYIKEKYLIKEEKENVKYIYKKKINKK